MPNSVSGNQLLPPSPLLTLTTVERNDAGWTVMARGPDQAPCPPLSSGLDVTSQSLCAIAQGFDRGRCESIAARACQSLAMSSGACAVRFFTDVLPGVAEVRGRRTCRADVVTQLIGHALGGRPGERLIGRLGLPVSDDTIVRWLKTRARAAITSAQVVGIDEWAKRKGLSFGTIVVDLEHRTVMDVLGDTHHRGRGTVAGCQTTSGEWSEAGSRH
jgi:hypothetical protein